MKLLLTTTLFFAINFASAQITQILPFSGLRYTEKGISAKQIDVDLDDKTWTSNQLPENSSFKIKLIKPKGFAVDDEGKCHPNIRVTLLNEVGDTMGHAEKFLGDGVVFDQTSLDDFSLTLGFKAGTPLGKYLIKATFYDLLSSNTLDIVFNIDFVKATEPKPTSNYVQTFTSYVGYIVKATDYKIDKVKLGEIDALKYEDKIVIPISITGIQLPKEVFSDKNLFSFSYHTVTKTTDVGSISDIQIKSGADETTDLELLITVPKSLYKKGDFVQFRWDSKDKKFVLDGVIKLL